MLATRIASTFTGPSISAIGAPAAADDYWYTSRSGTALSGEAVTAETALQVDAFFACLRVIAETMGYVPWFVYRRLPDGGRERAPEHPLYSKLHDQPNRFQTAFEWKEMMAGHIILRGWAYNRIVPGPSGPFDQLIPLHPDRVKQEMLPDGTRRYKYRNDQNMMETLAYDEVFAIPGQWAGKSILEAARENLGEAIAAQNYSSRGLKNRITPPGALKYPGKFKDEEAGKRLRASWEATYGGTENAGKPLILEEGMEWQQLGMTNEDAQFLQTRLNSVMAIARRFRMPPIMIGETEKQTSWGTGVESQQIGFVVFTMLPWFSRFESRANTDLLIDPRTYFTEMLADSLLRGDSKTRAEALQIARQNGVINANEWRLIDNRNPIDGIEGDMFWRPANMVPGDQLASRVTETITPGQNDKVGAYDPRTATYARVLAGQVVRKETERLKALAKRYADDGLGWESKVREFYGELAEELSQRGIEPKAAGAYASMAANAVVAQGVAITDGWEDGKTTALVGLMLEG